jgi:hypothetical protein
METEIVYGSSNFGVVEVCLGCGAECPVEVDCPDCIEKDRVLSPIKVGQTYRDNYYPRLEITIASVEQDGRFTCWYGGSALQQKLSEGTIREFYTLVQS